MGLEYKFRWLYSIQIEINILIGSVKQTSHPSSPTDRVAFLILALLRPSCSQSSLFLLLSPTVSSELKPLLLLPFPFLLLASPHWDGLFPVSLYRNPCWMGLPT